MKEVVVVFTKFPEAGKVKTRLANSIGHKAAVEVYSRLLLHTEQVLIKSNKNYVVYWGNYIPTDNRFFASADAHFLQCEGNLGDKMKAAFTDQFALGHEKVLGIGCDCYHLEVKHIEQSCSLLESQEVVFGPALDGGFYLFGMKTLQTSLFENLPWSTSGLLEICKQRLKNESVSFDVIDTLSDVDYFEDLPELWKNEFRV